MPTNETVQSLWTNFNLRGCLPVLEEMYQGSLEETHLLLAVGIGICAVILVQITALALAFAFVIDTKEEEDHEMIGQSIDSFNVPLRRFVN